METNHKKAWSVEIPSVGEVNSMQVSHQQVPSSAAGAVEVLAFERRLLESASMARLPESAVKGPFPRTRGWWKTTPREIRVQMSHKEYTRRVAHGD